VTPDQCSTAANDESLRCASVASVETMFARMGNQGLFEDIRVRKAFNLAIDKELIVNTILGGLQLSRRLALLDRMLVPYGPRRKL
jgi:ABC-type transport system substrate-binding protein